MSKQPQQPQQKKAQTAITPTRGENFAEWYQAVIAGADMAENSPVRGCMVIKPWGYGIWERIQRVLDDRIRETGHENCYFPLFIPLSFIGREAEHVEGFAKEMAVVTHHRLKMIDGTLQPDPAAKLEEPLVVRPTSETIIGDAFKRWIKSYRDLPILINQWANVVRWEMRTRLFLRTAEFLWQEGHTAHLDKADALAETMKMLDVYRDFAEGALALPVVAGEKPDNERFPGAENTFSIEAMMQDGKALQAGTSHYLGTHFSQAQEIKYQSETGEWLFPHTTSWGVSTRLIGALIMRHGDDDGLRVPPRVAPQQIVIVPLTREGNEAQVLAYCDELRARLVGGQALGEPIRASVDRRNMKPVEKRWNWVRRGAPIVCEVGGQEAEAKTVSFMSRDKLRTAEGRIASEKMPAEDFAGRAGAMLKDIQDELFAQAKAATDGNIRADIATFDDLAAFFNAAGEDETVGWVRVPWCKPSKAEHAALLDEIDERLKALKVSIRNAPLGQGGMAGKACIFTGKPAVEEVIVGRAY